MKFWNTRPKFFRISFNCFLFAQELETNGFCWQVPLLGGRLDKVFASPATLTVQKLGTLRCV